MKSRHTKRRIGLIGGVLLVLAGVAVNLAVAQPQGRPAPAPPPTRPVLPGMPQGYEQIVAVSLGGTDLKTQVVGSLIREIARQGLLIAAEAELGLTTLDDCIGEVIPGGTALPGPFTVNTIGIRQPQKIGTPFNDKRPFDFTISVTRAESGGQKVLWTSPVMTLPADGWYEPLVEEVEQLSRGPFVELLRNAGYEKSKATPAKPPQINSGKQLDIVSQFAAIQNLHAQMRASETAEILEQLARAYANLGSLTDFHWSPASKAFKARSLLYAQRLIAKYGTTPNSLAHRAYALALTGRHSAAVMAIQAAASGQGKPAPDWLGVIEAYCMYKPAILEQTKGDNQHLAQYLRTRMVDTRRDPHQSLKVLQDYVKENPGSPFALDMIASIPALGPQRQATEVAFNASWPHLYKQLAAVPDLPTEAKKIADGAKSARPDARSEYPKRKEVIRHLLTRNAVKGHPGPSWTVLGAMLDEITFAQAARIILTEVNMLGVNPNASLKRLGPLIKGHRFEPFLQSFGGNRTASPRALAEFAATIDVPSLEISTLPLAIEVFSRLGPVEGDRMIGRTRRNADNIFEDTAREKALPYGQDERYLFKISPYWPDGVLEKLRIGHSDKDGELEKQYSTSAVVLAAIAERHVSDGHLDDAMRCLKKAVDISPSCTNSMALAEIYRLRRDSANWLATMKTAATLPSLGLEHIDAHANLAEWYMRKGKWQDAKPHALEAAKAHSAMGLRTAARFYEGIDNWIEAEKYRRQESERYQESAEGWYFWCVRTGRGKVKDAKGLAAPNLQAVNVSNERAWVVAAGQLLEGNKSKAASILHESFKPREANPIAGLYAAVLADEEKNTALRDEIFDELAKRCSSKDVALGLANGFKGVLSGKDTGRWDPQVFHTLVTSGENETLIPCYYLAAGQFLKNHGESELSKQYLQAVATEYWNDLPAVIAADALRKSRIPFGKIRPNVLPDSVALLADYLADARLAQKYNQPDEAEAILRKLLTVQKESLPGLLARSNLFEAQGKFGEAIADLESAIRIDPNYWPGHTGLARLRATCERDEFRDGPKSLEHATRAASLWHFDTWETLTLQAWAHAETGQFEKATEFEKRAEKLPGNDGRTRDRLMLYAAGKAYRANTTAK